MTARAGLVPALGPRRKLGALAALGHNPHAVVAAMGRPPTRSARTLICSWRHPDRRWIDAGTAAQIDHAWHALRDHAGHDIRVRLYALRAGHRPPDWWTRQHLDDPRAAPRPPRTPSDPGGDQVADPDDDSERAA